jgi:hypothetical protein
MKAIVGRASVLVDRSVAECFALLSAVDRYPEWNGELVREAEVLERRPAGKPSIVRMTLHVAQSPFGKRFAFRAGFTAEPVSTVRLMRLADGPSDRERLEVAWSLHQEAGTRIELTFRAVTSLLPGFVPVFGIGDEIAAFLVGTVEDGLSRADPGTGGSQAG